MTDGKELDPEMEPAFLDDDGPSADIPYFIMTTNAHQLYGLREGETVADAILRARDTLKAEPSCAITAEQVRARLAAEYAEAQALTPAELRRRRSEREANQVEPDNDS